MARRAQLTGAAALAAAATAALTQRRYMQRVGSDPERAILERPLEGEPLHARSADGTELYGEAFGSGADPDRPTLVLVPGWTETITLWTYVVRELQADLRIAAFDLRGHGKSGRSPRADYSMARFGDDVEAMLEAGVPAGGRAVVAGHSLGGMSIAAWAEHHDVEARASAAALLFTGIDGLIGGQGLVYVPRFARGVNELVARRGFLGSRAPLPRFTTPLSAEITKYIAFGPTATPAQVAFYERMLIGCPPDIRAAAGLAMADMDLLHALKRLTVPTLVMAGSKDRLTPPAHARRIAAELPQLAELIELPETGHMGPLERPKEVSAALLRLAQKVAEAPPAAV
jgi:pimeloyl-ACP methyl ester carboxylesterase